MFMRERYADLGSKKSAEMLGRTRSAVRNQAYKMGITTAQNIWSERELSVLKSWYAESSFRGDVDLKSLAERLDRHPTAICNKASELGLTTYRRKKQHKKPPKIRERIYTTNEEWRAAKSAMMKDRHATRGHHMLGKTHTDEVKERLRETSLAFAARETDEAKSLRIGKALKTRLERHGTLAPRHPHGSWKAGWREIGGKRNYYRSRWEANYARYLEWLKQRGDIKEWAHEPETFWFEAIRRGVRSYKPDFRVWENDGSSKLHEVKGYMDDRSRTTLARMAKYHPQEKIVLIKEREYNAIARMLFRMIEGWETSDRADRP